MSLASALFAHPQRYIVDGTPPEGFRDIYEDALRSNAFVDYLTPSAGGQRSGWCHVDDVLGVIFDRNDWLFNQYAVFALRVEDKSVPSSILQPALRARVAAWCQESGRERCPAKVKAELRELVEAELLPRTQPKRQTYAVCWHLNEGWVTFAGTSASRRDAFRKLFHRTFGLRLVPADPLDVIEDGAALLACGAMDVIEGTIAKGEPVGDLDDRPVCPPHLASEFMLWLAWRAGESRALDLDGEPVEHWLDGRLDFRAPGEERACASVRDEQPVNAAALGALASGKIIRSIPLVLCRADREYVITLTGTDLARRGAKMPSLVKGGDLAEQVYEAAFLYEEMEHLLGELFSEFGRQRVASGAQGCAAIRRWLGLEVARVFRFDGAGQGWLFGEAR